MQPRELRLAIERGDFLLAPEAFAGDVNPKTLFARLDVALELAEALEGGTGSALRGQLAALVMDAEGPLTVRRVLQGSESAARVESRAGSPSWNQLRALYGLDGERWSERGQFVSARLAGCLAADVTWMPYAHGVLLARDRSPASLEVDLRALASTAYAWSVQDYPAVAKALGAALDCGDREPSLPFRSFARLVVAIVRPHIGGSFAPTQEHQAVTEAATAVARELARLLRGPQVPLFTGSRLAGIMLARLEEALQTDLRAHDPVRDFERASAELVFGSMAGTAEVNSTIDAIERLRDGMRLHLA